MNSDLVGDVLRAVEALLLREEPPPAQLEFYCGHCKRLVPMAYEAVRRHVQAECRSDH